MTVRTFNKNDMGQNIYLYYDEKADNEKYGVLIDAGCSVVDRKAIDSHIEENNIIVKGILLTHGHFDHISAADEMKNLAPVYCHELERQMLGSPDLNLSVLVNKDIVSAPDHLLVEGDVFRFGDALLKVLHTPGHTPGGVCYYDEENGNLFAGDTLFKEAVGRTDFPYADHHVLIENISKKLFVLPDDVKVYPGHGFPSTIGHEKLCNPFTK